MKKLIAPAFIFLAASSSAFGFIALNCIDDNRPVDANLFHIAIEQTPEEIVPPNYRLTQHEATSGQIGWTDAHMRQIELRNCKIDPSLSKDDIDELSTSPDGVLISCSGGGFVPVEVNFSKKTENGEISYLYEVNYNKGRGGSMESTTSVLFEEKSCIID